MIFQICALYFSGAGMKHGELKPGGRIGDYVLKERIGKGLFGEVWKAVHESRNLTVALKVLKEDAASLVSEEQVFHRMTHDSIVRIEGGSLDGEIPHIAMEFIEGVSLRVYLKNKVLPIPVTLEVFRDVVEGIEHAHAGGHIHGNLKPENILVTKAVHAKVCDFGFGLALAGKVMPGSGGAAAGIIGALDYMSPEQMRGEGADKRDDVYSLGRLLFEVLSGHVPAGIDETLTSQLDSSVAADFDAIYVRCCVERESRYENAAGLLEDVTSIIENGHISLETARMAGLRRSEKRAPVLELQSAVRDFVENFGGRWDDEQWVEFLMSLYERGLAAGWSQEQVARLAEEIRRNYEV
jgi:serine/threonine-protein kinase